MVALIADDSINFRRKITSLLHDLGYEVLQTKDGREAIDTYSEKRPDFVVMDINMPDMDGITALQHIIKIDADAKVIIATAQGLQNTVIEAFKNGALAYLLKPITEEKIKHAIETIYNKNK